MFRDSGGVPTDRSLIGHAAAGVPGSVAGMWDAHQRFGSLPWAELIGPAIQLADGFVVHEREDLARYAAVLAPPGRVRLSRPHRDSRCRHPHPAAPRSPKCSTSWKGTTWKHWDITQLSTCTSGPRRPKVPLSIATPSSADPDFVPQPTEQMISDAYAAERRSGIRMAAATPSAEARPRRFGIGFHRCSGRGKCAHDPLLPGGFENESPFGNHSLTTLNSLYGNFVAVSGAGFLLNNEMDDFATRPGSPNQFGLVQGEANAIQPDKRMLSAMAPTHSAGLPPGV